MYDFDAGQAEEALRIRHALQRLVAMDGGGETEPPCISVTRTPFDEMTVFAGPV